MTPQWSRLRPPALSGERWAGRVWEVGIRERHRRRLNVVHGVAVIWFPVTDLDRSVEFYAETLGLDRLNQEDDWAELEANGLRVGLNARGDETPGGEGGGVLAFQPDDQLADVGSGLQGNGGAVAG